MTDAETITTQARIINDLLDRVQQWRNVADLQHRAMTGVLGTAIDQQHAQWWRDAQTLYLEALTE
jgi:transcription initiation factor TFIID subunit TAF12